MKIYSAMHAFLQARPGDQFVHQRFAPNGQYWYVVDVWNVLPDGRVENTCDGRVWPASQTSLRPDSRGYITPIVSSDTWTLPPASKPDTNRD